jgi:propanol-preferring alcohol dehydrogenase
MKAYRFVEYQAPPRFEDVAVPEPGPGQVLVKVAGAGVCHSDLHVLEWPAAQNPLRPPFTLGHENAGFVEKLGAGVDRLRPGDPVAVYGPWGCGTCRTCRQGIENYCERQAENPAMGGGLGLDGGMAEYMLVPSPRLLVPLGSLDPREAAPLTDAGLTPYHAIKRSLGLLAPGASVAVIGVGGLGNMGVQILRALTAAQIVAVDKDEDKLRLAREVGADRAVRAGDGAFDEIREITRGRGVEVAIDFVGADATIALAAKIARQQGHVTVVGLGGGTFPFGFFALPYECSLATTYWGSVTELMEVIALAAQGRIKVLSERFPLERAPEAYQRLRSGTIRGRAVIVPHG